MRTGAHSIAASAPESREAVIVSSDHDQSPHRHLCVDSALGGKRSIAEFSFNEPFACKPSLRR